MMNNKQPTKRFLVFCEPCSYKKILTSDSPEDMTKIKTSDVPGGAPRLDPTTKKAVNRPGQQQSPKVKCPQCGRGAVIRNLPDVYSKAYQQVDDLERKSQEELEKKQRIEDGKPIKRDPNLDDYMPGKRRKKPPKNPGFMG